MTDTLSRRALLGALGATPMLAAAQQSNFPPLSIPFAAGDLWPWLRAQLVLDPDTIWLDSAAFGPTIRAALVREYRVREQRAQRFDRHLAGTLGPENMSRLIGAIAGFLGAPLEEIALTRGTAEGLALVARGLDLQAGDEILTTRHEHPSATYPWLLEAQRRGLKLVQLPLTGPASTPAEVVGRFAGAITPRTRVLLFSHVQYTDGTLMPVRELAMLAKSNRAIAVVDGAQGPGHLDFRVADLGCDVYATSFHKWLCGPYATGAVWIRPELRTRIVPLHVESHHGWRPLDRFDGAIATETGDGWPVTQRIYGQASRYFGPELEGVPIACELHRVLTPARIAARIRELAAYLRLRAAELPGVSVVSPAQGPLSAGIVALRPAARDVRELARSIAGEDSIVVGAVVHGTEFAALRVSPHAYTELAQIDRFVDALRRRL
jgi:selenocysteine lyase/cysteine desulfurase